MILKVMKYLSNNDSLCIFNWMIKDLHLCGSSLILYAVIYRDCKKFGEFTMPLRYLCEWAGVTKQGALKALKKLEESNIIKKEVYYLDGAKQCKYKVVIPKYIRSDTL